MPEILIGQDNYNLMLPFEIRDGKCNEPCATRTPQIQIQRVLLHIVRRQNVL